ncbi:hypothetical protein GRF29_185g274284 [Pseudopithomyces chartarum]|uniref:Uncharacterized protein n=1 Tax=Pseudopithomyces chartarum TaxID=1892770 RepID=A0AAN6RD65_9PLEO|nr:hypothetical protein GRF29_185g274284 [Pseudopithomyces chartarum]
MGSDEYYGLYDDEIDMNFSTYSKPKRNTQPIQLRQKKNGKNKKKAKSSGSIEKVAVAPSTSKIKDSALKPDTTESETNKKTMQLGLFPVEIMDLILEELWDDDRKGFMNLSYTSKFLRLNSERILFRTLVISDKAPWVRRVTTSVLERLVDEDDCNLWKCIRHIEVGPITDADWFYKIAYPSLCQILGNLKNLQSLTWATPLSTTPAHAHAQTKQPSILEALQTWHPHAKLKFVCHNRDFHGEFMPIDEALLSSPQLHTLDATLSLMQDCTHPPDYEVQLLKQSLIHGASIKVLRFNIQDPSNHHHVFTPSPPVSFTWHPTDSFPPLEELSLPQARPKYHSAYNLNRDDLLMWARAMDWTHMRRLDFHHHNPSLFFATFTDRVPNLKYLRWGLLPSQDGSGWNRTPTCASAFMRSVTALEEVVFNGEESEEVDGGVLVEQCGGVLDCSVLGYF